MQRYPIVSAAVSPEGTPHSDGRIADAEPTARRPRNVRGRQCRFSQQFDCSHCWWLCGTSGWLLRLLPTAPMQLLAGSDAGDGRTDGRMHASKSAVWPCLPLWLSSCFCFAAMLSTLGPGGPWGPWGVGRQETRDTHPVLSADIQRPCNSTRDCSYNHTHHSPPPLLPPPRVALSVPPCPHLQLLQRPRLQQPPRPRSTPSGWAVSHYCCARRARKRLSLATT